MAGRVVPIYVRGWEPLGINGTYATSETDISHIVNNNWRAQNARKLQCSTRDSKHYVEQVGGWGNLKFNLNDILNRIQAGWAETSESFETFADIRFDWIRVYCVPTKYLDWVGVGTTHFPIDNKQNDNRAHWGHPLHLMLQKGRIFVPSLLRSQRKLFYGRKYKPSSQFTTSFFDKTYFKSVDFFYWLWSYVDLHLPSGAPQDDEFLKKVFVNKYKNNWFKDKTGAWRDRINFEKQNTNPTDDNWNQYDNIWNNWSAFLKTTLSNLKSYIDKFWPFTTVSHTPMCPPVLWTKELVQAQFFYHIKFSGTGRTIQSVNPGSAWEVREPQKYDKCPDTGCTACLNESDISEGGTICPSAFARITSLDNYNRLDAPKRGRDGEETEEESTPRAKIRRCLQFISECLRK